MANKLKSPESLNDYAKLCSYASTYTQAWLHRKQGVQLPVVTAVRSVRGIDEDRARASTEVFMCNEQGKLTRISSQSLDVAKPVAFDISPSGSLTLALHSSFYGITGSKEEKAIIEVTSDSGESYRIDAFNVHGAFMGDTWFGGCSWSADERFVAYIAVAKVEKPQTYFGSQSYTTSSEGTASASASSTKYNYTEDWGERFGGIGALGLFVLDVAAQAVHKIGDIDTAQYTVGQPCLIATDVDGVQKYILAYTAFSNLPRKLGLFSCFQRPHSVFVTDLTELLGSPPSAEPRKLQHHLLSAGLKTARSARCSSDGRQVVFLGQEKGFEEHNGCSELFATSAADIVALTSGASASYRKVVAQVNTPEVVSTGTRPTLAFPGIYCESLPTRCFSSASSVVLPSQWGSDTIILSVDLDTGACQPLREACTAGTTTVLDVAQNLVLFAHSTPTAPSRLRVLDTQQSRVAWSQDAPAEQAVRLLRATAAGVIENKNTRDNTPNPALQLRDGAIAGLGWEVFSHTADSILFESILIYPTGAGAGLPIVVVPHGGPHSCMTTAYFHAYAFLAHTLGAAVLHVNYRGSPGFGQDSIHSLPGKIGKNDVDDMMTALNRALALRFDASTARVSADSTHPLLVNSSRVSVVGGSHGGFLAGHLIGQYPEVFKAAAMRNPVTNIPAMYSVSDIPGKSKAVLACSRRMYGLTMLPCIGNLFMLPLQTGARWRAAGQACTTSAPTRRPARS
jgi:acylaminoacyl-peptidase